MNDAVRRMLEPRSLAVVGASARAGSFGQRLAFEALRSPAGPRVHLVNPGHREVLRRRCVASLTEVPEPVDLVLLGVPDGALLEQVRSAAGRGDAGAVVFGGAGRDGPEVAATAREAGMALCGASCMGFVNVARGVRAIGYLERERLVSGPIALITHSGSLFSALLRTHRRLEYSLAVSSGQELVTTTPDYLEYALDLPETRVVGLFLETLREVPRLRTVLRRAADADVPVVALTAGSSRSGRRLVRAHSQALAGDDAAWEALFGAYGVHRVHDLDELVDTLELFAVGRRVRRQPGGSGLRGIATVHDSGGERALTADLAAVEGVRFAQVDETTESRLAAVVEAGVVPGNPMDVWATGADAEHVIAECLAALADDEAVEVTALAVDLVEEYDADESYPRAVQKAHDATGAPMVVLSAVPAAVDQRWAARLRAAGVPVLEGLRPGLRSLRHLLDAARPPSPLPAAAVDEARRARWHALLTAGPLSPSRVFDLLADYEVPVAATQTAGSAAEAVRAADRLGYPAVLKTAAADHKSDVGGVAIGLQDSAALADAYAEMASRLGPDVLVQAMSPPGVELALGVLRDPHVGPLVLVAAGGTLTELIGARAVALPPLDVDRAEALLDKLPSVAGQLAGLRGTAPADRAAVVSALVGVAQLALELGDVVEALDVNPLICGAYGAVAVDALLVSPAVEPPVLHG